MNTKEHALKIFEFLKQNKPAEFFDELNNLNSGMRYILVFLYETKNEVYASTLSTNMKISRARVAILIKKLLSKNFITKQVSDTDARKEVLQITTLGIKQVENGNKLFLERLERMIEKFGFEKINAFIETANDIKNFILEETK